MTSDPWTGDAHCRFCLQSHADELEVFCAACDRPMCLLCVVRERFGGELLCPECAAENARTDEAAGAAEEA